MPRLFPVALSAWLAASQVAALNLRPTGSALGIRRLVSDDFNQLGNSIYGAPASANHGNVEFGMAVELPANGGSRVAVGAPRHDWSTPIKNANFTNEDGGGVFVYDFVESNWDRIWFLAGIPGERIGDRLSLSADGSRIAVRRYKPNGVEIYSILTSDSPARESFIEGQDDGDTVSLSPAGDRLAISCETFLEHTGRVQIFEERNGQWDSIGVIDGVNPEDHFGWVTAFSSSGDRLAISAPYHDGDLQNRGLVRVYDYDSERGDWVQIGSDVEGSGKEDRFGFSMDLSRDGFTLVVGSPHSNDDGKHTGKVNVYRLIEGSWVLLGNEIFGLESNDRLGSSVSISDDGNRIAASSFTHDQHRGHVRVFELVENLWTPVGSDLDGAAPFDHSGFGLFGVTLSGDGLFVASGSVFAENADEFSTGRVRVFEAPPRPTDMPSAAPSLNPTVEPSSSPSVAPSFSAHPSFGPSAEPSLSQNPSFFPSGSPSRSPTGSPSGMPTEVPSGSPSAVPTAVPSSFPSKIPTQSPESPSVLPSSGPSLAPSTMPSSQPSDTSKIGASNTPFDPFKTSSAAKSPFSMIALFAAAAVSALMS